MSQTARYYQLIDGTTADMVGFFEHQTDLDDVLLEDFTEHGADSVRNLVLLIGDETGPDSTMTGDELVRYAEGLARTPTRS
jgi:hypothetical protein